MALPLSWGVAYGSRSADGPGKLGWSIHQPGYWRPPRPLHPWFEEQLAAYPEDALVLAPLHLGEWNPPLRVCGRCQHKEEATSRFRCACHRDRWREAALAATGHWRVLDGEALLVVSNVPGSRTCLVHTDAGPMPSFPGPI